MKKRLFTYSGGHSIRYNLYKCKKFFHCDWFLLIPIIGAKKNHSKYVDHFFLFFV